jgi:exodeoxyribonuclease X
MTAVIFDTEATGITEPRLIEAAWLRLPDPNNLTPAEIFCQRYNPEKPISLGALATHHIMDEELVDCPSYTTFKLPDDAQYLIGHNVDYDWKVIGQPDIKRICVLAFCRSLFPQLDSHTQSAMIYHLCRPTARELLKGAHSALADVYNCRTILSHVLRMIAKPAEQLTWDAVWQRSEQARIPVVMSFGKHKGTAIKDVPADYKRWFLGQPDVDPYLAEALRA